MKLTMANMDKAYFLNEDEKALMQARKDAEYGQTKAAQEFSKADVFKAFKDWKCWAFWLAQFGTDTMLYGYLQFMHV